MKSHIIILLTLVSLFPSGCIIDHDKDCSFTLCTEEFRSILILIKNSSDNSPVILSRFEVWRISDYADITIADSDLTDNNGYYTIVNDSNLEILRNRTVEVEFRGFKNGNLIVQRRFMVGGDCCHVLLLAGENEVYI